MVRLKRDSQTNAELEAKGAEIESLNEEIKLLKKSNALVEETLRGKELERSRLEKLVNEREEAGRRDEVRPSTRLTVLVNMNVCVSTQNVTSDRSHVCARVANTFTTELRKQKRSGPVSKGRQWTWT